MVGDVRASSCQRCVHAKRGFTLGAMLINQFVKGCSPNQRRTPSPQAAIVAILYQTTPRERPEQDSFACALKLHFLQLRLRRWNCVQRFDHSIGKLAGASGPADIAGEVLLLGIDLLDCRTDVVGRILLAQVTKHEDTRAKHRRRVGHVFSRNVRRRAVYGFEDGAFVPEVRARHQAKSSDERRAQIRDDVAVQVLQQQDVVLVRIHYQLHASVVHNMLAVGDLGIVLGNVARAADEQPVRQLHDVGFVDGVDFLAMHPPRIFEGKLRNARGRLLGDDLQALDHAGNDLVLDAGVQPFGVLANDDEVHAGIARGYSREIADRPEVGEKLELLAQRDIDAGESAADRGRHRTFQADARALDGLHQFLGNVLVILLIGFGAGGVALPLKLYAGCLQNADGCPDDLGADTVAGY